MSNSNISTSSFTTDDVVVIFRGGGAGSAKNLAKLTMTDIIDKGIPVDDDTKPLRAISAKLRDEDGFIFVGSMDTVDVHYVDGTSQSLSGFLEEYDGTGIYEITYSAPLERELDDEYDYVE